MRSELRYLVLVGIACVMISFGVFGAVTIRTGNCNTGEDVLFKYSSDNGHVATWNSNVGEGYANKVCVTKKTGANRVCVEGNPSRVFRVNGVMTGSGASQIVYNAHIEGANVAPATEGYVDICYGNVNCEIVEGRDCYPGQTKVASVSGKTNAHVADLGFEGYTKYLCCAGLPGLNTETCEARSGEGYGCFNCPSPKICEDTKADYSCDAGKKCCKACRDIGECDVVAKIEKPKEGEIFLVNHEVSFEQFAQGDATCPNLKFKWSFGDGTTKEYDSTKPTEGWNTAHTYTTDGIKEVLLEVWSKPDKSDIDSAKVKILIVKNNMKYVFAEITKPEEGASYPLYSIPYDATGTYAIEIDSNGDAKCLAGKCRKTGGVNVINPSEASLDAVKFSWDYDTDGSTNKEGAGAAYAEFPENAFFYKKPGQYTSTLTASLVSDITIKDTDFANFFVAGCGGEGTTWWDINRVSFNTTNLETGDKCQGFDNIAGGGDDCCPTGKTCKEYGATTRYVCQNSEYCNTHPIKYCRDYGTDKEKCESNFCNVRNFASGCTRCIFVNNKCTEYCNPNFPDDTRPGIPICTKNPKPGQDIRCDESGYRKVEYEVEVIENGASQEDIEKTKETCIDSTERFPCGERMNLPFFSMINVIFAVMLLLAYYCLGYKKR